MGSSIFSTELKHIGNDPGLVQVRIVKGSAVAVLDGLHSAMEKATGNHSITYP